MARYERPLVRLERWFVRIVLQPQFAIGYLFSRNGLKPINNADQGATSNAPIHNILIYLPTDAIWFKGLGTDRVPLVKV